MHKHYGAMQFVWFEGIVEDRHDPEQLGRVRVRCLGYHTPDTSLIPTEDLHWAIPVLPLTSGGTSGITVNPSVVEGAFVYGWFRDGPHMQDPIIIGSINGIVTQPNYNQGFSDPGTNVSARPRQVQSIQAPSDGTGISVTERDPIQFPDQQLEGQSDLHPLTRGASCNITNIISTVHSSQQQIPAALGSTFNQPDSQAKRTYPYNAVRGTESGHIEEYDDSPGAERQLWFHRTGTHVEHQPNGNRVETSVNDRFCGVHKDDYLHVDGKQYVTIDKGKKVLINADQEGNSYEIEVGSTGDLIINVAQGDVNLTVNGDVMSEITGNVNETVGGNVTRDVGGNVTETIGGNLQRTVSGNYTENVGGNTTHIASGNVVIQGATINLN